MTTHTDLIARLRKKHNEWKARQRMIKAADAIKSLEQQVAALTKERDRAEQQVKELLWDDPVEPSFGPAFGDLLVYLNHQTPHPTELYQMMSNGTKLWQQMKDQVAALTKERDDLETECAVHAACTKLRVKQLAATQARESRLREALAGLREHSLCPDTMVRLLDTPTDDSALMERLKEERDRCALLLDNASGKGSIISCVSAAAAIRSMT